MFTSGLSRPAADQCFTDVEHSAPFIWSNRANSLPAGELHRAAAGEDSHQAAQAAR